MSEIYDGDRPGAAGGVSGKLARLEALAGELAREDWAGLPATVQDEAIRVLERAEAAQAAIRGAALAAFADGPGCSWYGQQSMTSFLVAETRVTRAAATGHAGWAKRHARHPRVMAALAAMQITVSIAIRICGWSDLLPEEHRDSCEEILVAAWQGGCTIGDLAMLARQMLEELAPDQDGKPPVTGVTLDTTFDGAGLLRGDLAPGVTALVKAAFATWAQKQGPEDHRTLAERQHAALGEICRQVLTLAGQPAPAPERDPASTTPAGDDTADG